MKSGVHPVDHSMLMMKVPKKQEEAGAEDAKEGGDESVVKVAEEAEEGGDESVVKEAEDAKVQGDEEPVHWCYRCDGCKMDPIVGARYKCLEWVLFTCNRCTFC